MSRRKTRVTHMSRRKARSGTRKRKGGWGLPSWFPNPFAKNTDDPNALAPVADAKAAAVAPPVPPATAPAPSKGWFGGLFSGGGRKTRHRRRRHHK